MKKSKQFMAITNRFRKLTGGVPRIEAGRAAGLRFDTGPEAASYLKVTVEMPVQETVSALLQRGDGFYDVGANVGFFSIIASRIVGPTGAVFAPYWTSFPSFNKSAIKG